MWGWDNDEIPVSYEGELVQSKDYLNPFVINCVYNRTYPDGG